MIELIRVKDKLAMPLAVPVRAHIHCRRQIHATTEFPEVRQIVGFHGAENGFEELEWLGGAGELGLESPHLLLLVVEACDDFQRGNVCGVGLRCCFAGHVC